MKRSAIDRIPKTTIDVYCEFTGQIICKVYPACGGSVVSGIDRDAEKGIMEGTLTGDKFIVIFEHDFAELPLDGYLFWRESCGYIQLWFINGVVFDVLKRDEGRYMFE